MLLAFAMLLPACGSENETPDGAAPADPTTLPADLEAAWVRTRQREAGPAYAFRPDPRGGWLAYQPHVERDLRVVGDGVVMGEGPGAARLRVGAIGRAGHMGELPAADVAVRENRAAHAFGGSASEIWYLNGPLGLEQGLTLDRRARGDGELVVRVDVTGADVVPLYGSQDPQDSERHRAREIEVRVGDIAVRYHTIFATDATGRLLPAHFETNGAAIELHVDDADATYPLEIDPLIVTVQKLASADVATSDSAGGAVSLSGDYAVVGAAGDDDKGTSAGAAYVFRRQAGVWSQIAKLLAPDGAASDAFGSSVAITATGTTGYVAVGAPMDDSERGSVYVWSYSASTATYQTKIVPATAVAGDKVGSAVGLDTTTLVIGAPKDDETPGVDCGSVYVFVWGTSWTQQAKLSPAPAGDQLGYSVAVSGNLLVAGAPIDFGSAGAAYVYSRSVTTWTQAAFLYPSDFAGGDRFGEAVAISGTSVLIGAPKNDDGATDAGSAYVFVSGTPWLQQGKFVASDPITNRMFGVSVGISGASANHVVIGGDTTANGAYVALRAGATWPAAVTATKILGTGTASGDAFGRSVAISGVTATPTLLVGAPLDDWIGPTTDAGSAYAFLYGASWFQQAQVQATDGSHDDQFGTSVDVSGTTAIIGAPGDDDAGLNAGAVYIFLKTGSVWALQQRIPSNGGTTSENFGTDVAVSGDVAVIGAPYADDVATNSGAVYVYTRSGVVWTKTLRLKLAGAAAEDRFGLAVAIDVNSFAAAAPLDDNAVGADAGTVVVYDKASGSWALRSTLTGGGGAAGDQTGYSLALDADRLVAGAPFADDGGASGGAVCVYSRASYGSTWGQLARLAPTDAVRAGDFFGWDVAYVSTSGGLLVAGAPGDTEKGTDAGAVFSYSGTTTFSPLAKITASDGVANDWFGLSVAVTGPVALIGAPGDDAARGSAYVYQLAGGSWVFQQNKIVASDGLAGHNFARAVAVDNHVALMGALYAPSPDYRSGAAYAHDLTGLGGDLCGSAAVCGSGFCVDGVCCNAACGGSVTNDCQACGATAGAVVNGTCGALSAAVAPTVVCRTSAGVCDVSDVCSSASTVCPADVKVTAGTSCRGAAGVCDLVETCDGSANACPADIKRPTSYVCRAAGPICDKEEKCTGGNDCPADVSYVPGDNITCRMVAGVCDLAEICAGAPDCPVDSFASGTECRGSAGVCDVVETCPGTSAACPTDAFYSSSTVCRGTAGVCDVAEQCTGSTAVCPGDAFEPPSTMCRAAAGICDVEDLCTGSAAACSADVRHDNAFVCRAVAGGCDVAETCAGDVVCPADAYVALGTTCRVVAGPCDVAETCPGSGPACPVDAYEPASLLCRAAAGICDVDELCTGAAAACPTDAFVSSAVTCRAATGVCDIAEQCLGTAAACPANALRNSSYVCRAAATPPTCDGAENCTGVADTCPADIVVVAGTSCRADSDGGGCDAQDFCDGVDMSCADDTLSATCELQNVSIAPGRYHTCVVRADGKLYCWGDNTFGQLGLNSTTASLTPAQVGTATNWSKVAAGAFHTCATNTVGQVYCWGRNDRGQVGVTPSPAVLVPTQVGSFSTAAAVALGDFHSCTLVGAAVWCWGANAFGQLGRGAPLTDSSVPTAVSGSYTQVASGSNHSCALASTGAVSCWGSNATGQLGAGVPGTLSSALPLAVSGVPPVSSSEQAIAVAAGGPRTCIIYRGHRVMCWGSNAELRAGDALGYSSIPLDMNITGVASITLGESHLCARQLDGDVACWGDNRFGQLGDESTQSRWLVLPSSVATTRDVVSIVTGHMHTCAVLYPVTPETTAPVVCWGRGEEGQLGDGNDLDRVRIPELVGWTDAALPTGVAGGWSHSCANTAAGEVYCWGDARYGVTGTDLTDGVRYVPSAVGVSDAESVFAGDGFSCARTLTGAMKCWGRNDRGQLAQPTCLSTACAVATVSGLGSVDMVAVGRAHACAVGMMSGDAAPQLYCWGANGEGQLGDGTLVDRSTPTRITLPYTPIGVAAGESHTCVVAADVSTYHVYCWGRNSEGQVGDGTFGGDAIDYVPPGDTLDAGLDLGAPPDAGVTFSRLTPRHHTETLPFPFILAGRNYSCTGDIVASELVLRCWGKNTHGELGDGTRTHRNLPTLSLLTTQLPGLTGGGAGEAFMCLITNGTEKCWGRNDAAQLGHGDTVDYPTAFVTVSGVSAVTAASNGLAHACAISGSASPGVYCWGRNEYGQVGDLGFRANRVAPATVLLP